MDEREPADSGTNNASSSEPVNGTPWTASDLIEGVRQEAYVFWMLRVNINGGCVHESELANLKRWEQDYSASFPPGIGTEFILGVMSAGNFFFAQAMAQQNPEMIGSAFHICGCAAVALDERGYFDWAYSGLEKEALRRHAKEIFKQHQEARKQLRNPVAVMPEREAD